MYKAVPPLQEMFNMAGMQLPNFLKGENVEEVKSDEIKEEKKSDKK
jgi:flotillin